MHEAVRTDSLVEGTAVGPIQPVFKNSFLSNHMCGTPGYRVPAANSTDSDRLHGSAMAGKGKGHP